MSDNKIELSREWFSVTKIRDEAIARERELRALVIAAYFGEEKKKGTTKAELKPGVKLSLSVSEKVSINKEEFEKHKAELAARGFIKDDGLIKTSYSVSASALKHLADSDRIKFASIFEYKLESPQLNVEVKED
jgi:hypothetical protein